MGMFKIIWRHLSSVLHFDIQFKHVIIGFYFKRNVKTHFLNKILSFVAYYIYKFKMFCRSQNKTETRHMMVPYIENNLQNNIIALLKLQHTFVFKSKLFQFVEVL